MAKVTFSSLKLKTNISEPKTITINDKEIIIKQYLPMAEKLELISNILNSAVDNIGYINPIKLEVFTNLEIVKAYSNITFTDKQLEDVAALYDVLETNNVINSIVENIPEDEYLMIIHTAEETLSNFYTYKNSIGGMIEDVISSNQIEAQDGADKIQKIQEQITSNPENIKLLKDVVTKLG